MSTQHFFFIFSNLGLGGVQKRIVDLANYIAESPEYKQTTIHILIKEVEGFTFIPHLRKSDRVIIHQSFQPPRVRRLTNLFFLLSIIYHSLRFRPNSVLVFLHFSLPGLLLLKILVRKTKFVLSQDNILSYYNALPHVNTVFSPKSIRFLYSFLDTVIVQTHFARRDLIQNFRIPPEKVTVIPNWGPNPKKTTQPQKNKLYDLLYAGRLARQKQLEKFIELISILKRSKKNITAVVYGEGPEKDELERMIRIRGLEKNVQLLPTTHSLEKELPKARFFCLTSLFEGHPMVLLEAMACGTVPAVLEYPGCNEYLQKNVDALVEKDVNSLSEKILYLMKEPKAYKNLSRQAQESVEKRYNYHTLIQETLSTLAK